MFEKTVFLARLAGYKMILHTLISLSRGLNSEMGKPRSKSTIIPCINLTAVIEILNGKIYI